MWGIDHPSKVFEYVGDLSQNILNCILTESQFDSYPEESKTLIKTSSLIKMNKINILDPNNPAKRISSVHIYIERSDNA